MRLVRLEIGILISSHQLHPEMKQFVTDRPLCGSELTCMPDRQTPIVDAVLC